VGNLSPALIDSHREGTNQAIAFKLIFVSTLKGCLTIVERSITIDEIKAEIIPIERSRFSTDQFHFKHLIRVMPA
jgi:hypothetical protein